MTTDRSVGNGTVIRFDISPATDAQTRAWAIRLHLRRGQTVTAATVDGVEVMPQQLVHLTPLPDGHGFFPFGGKDTRPAPRAGHIVQMLLPSSAGARSVVMVSSQLD